MQTITDAQLFALDDALAKTRGPLLAAFRLMAFSGLRLSETLAIRWEQIGTPDGTVLQLELEAAQTKTRQPRAVPLTPTTITALLDNFTRSAALLSHAPLPDWHALPGTRPKAWSTRFLQREIARVSRRELGIHLHPHMLRHTFATRLLRHAPLPVVQAALGHINPASTLIYTHPDHNDVRAAVLRAAADRPKQ